METKDVAEWENLVTANEDIECFTDYVLIAQGMFMNDTKSVSRDKYCGYAFPSEVTSELNKNIVRVQQIINNVYNHI